MQNSLEYIRIVNAETVKMMHIIMPACASALRFGGSIKFDISPAGGGNAGFSIEVIVRNFKLSSDPTTLVILALSDLTRDPWYVVSNLLTWNEWYALARRQVPSVSTDQIRIISSRDPGVQYRMRSLICSKNDYPSIIG